MTTLTTLRTANRVLGTIAPAFTAGLARRLMMRPTVNQPRAWELPARDTAEKITFRFGLGGYRWGTSGPTVLMMHGWQGRPTQFACFVEPLLASGRQVIALEAPAHGRSPDGPDRAAAQPWGSSPRARAPFRPPGTGRARRHP